MVSPDSLALVRDPFGNPSSASGQPVLKSYLPSSAYILCSEIPMIGYCHHNLKVRENASEMMAVASLITHRCLVALTIALLMVNQELAKQV